MTVRPGHQVDGRSACLSCRVASVTEARLDPVAGRRERQGGMREASGRSLPALTATGATQDGTPVGRLERCSSSQETESIRGATTSRGRSRAAQSDALDRS